MRVNPAFVPEPAAALLLAAAMTAAGGMTATLTTKKALPSQAKIQYPISLPFFLWISPLPPIPLQIAWIQLFKDDIYVDFLLVYFLLGPRCPSTRTAKTTILRAA
jgi:hypothetical protein